MLRRGIYWFINGAALFALWFLFTGSLDGSEVLAGAGAAALAAFGVETVRGQEHPRFLPHAHWVLRFYRLPAQILMDSWRLLRHLPRARSEPGFFRMVRFNAGGEDKRAIARRSLAILYTTLPANSLVVGIDRKGRYILYHVVEPAPPPAILRELEAGR